MVPTTLISRARRHSEKSAPSTPPKIVSRAATLTRASRWPKRSKASLVRRTHCSGSVMSVTCHATRSPDGSTSRAIFSRLASVRAPSTTLAPSRTAAAAISRPSPGPVPDTTTVLPSRINSRLLSPSTQVRGADDGVAADLVGRSVGDHRAQVEHHDPVALAHDEPHVVLHENDRAALLGPHPLQHPAQVLRLGILQPRRGLVQEEHPRGIDDGARQLQHPGPPDGERRSQLPPHVGKAAQLDDLLGPAAPVPLPRSPGRKPQEVSRQAAAASPPLEGDQKVVLRRQPAERLLVLERAAEPTPGPPRGGASGDVEAVVGD